MKNEIINSIAISEEVLSTIPKTEKIKYIGESKKIYSQYNMYKLQIIEEMKQRVKSIDIVLSKDDFVYSDYEDLLEKINIISKTNTPCEKLHLDRALFNLKKYYKSNFKELNDYIFDVIDIFKLVGIKLKEEDFFYDECEKAYMKELLNLDRNNYSSDDLKGVFEVYYWKNPNIINNIYYNFRAIYYKNLKTFDKYIKNKIREINLTVEVLSNEYKEKIILQDQNYDKNPKRFVTKFMNEEFVVKDFTKSNIQKISETLFDGEAADKERMIINLNKTLKEYNTYLKYKNLIDVVKNEIKGKGKEKIVSSKKLKEIIKIENQLRKSVKNKNKSPEELIDKIKVLYDEYDDLYFKERMFSYLNENSKILNGIEFLTSYFDYFVKLMKNENKEITINEVLISLNELKKFSASPYNTLINNVDLVGENDIVLIIVDKYKLDNVIINKESLEVDAIETLIENTELLLNYSKLNNLENILLEQIFDYYKIKKLLNGKK